MYYFNFYFAVCVNAASVHIRPQCVWLRARVSDVYAVLSDAVIIRAIDIVRDVVAVVSSQVHAQCDCGQ